MNTLQYTDILSFWFNEIDEASWWKKDKNFDQLIRDRFTDIHQQANAGELHQWRKNAHGRLAEIIVLDQFSRNMFRDKPESFSSDNLALILAQEAILQKADQQFNSIEKSFLYMPFMHSESLYIHDIAVTLFDQTGLESNLAFEHKHKVIIEQFGRYPHRNKILGRESTDEETTFLEMPNSSF